MSWFDEQIKQRKLSDDQLFTDSFVNIANAVTGERLHASDEVVSKDAIEQVLKFYGCKITQEVPSKVSDFYEQLEYVCRPHGIMYRDVKLTEGWYKDAYGAFLARRSDNGNHVALIPDAFGYKFFDGNKYIKINKKNADIIAENAICFYKPFPLKKLNLFDLVKY